VSAQTTSDGPRPMSPAAKTPSTLVMKCSSRATRPRSSSVTPRSASSPVALGPQELEGVHREQAGAAFLVGAGGPVDRRVGRPRHVRAASLMRPGPDVDVGHRPGPLPVRGAQAVGAGVAATDNDHVLALGGDRGLGHVALLHPVRPGKAGSRRNPSRPLISPPLGARPLGGSGDSVLTACRTACRTANCSTGRPACYLPTGQSHTIKPARSQIGRRPAATPATFPTNNG
jgi:hypothetical protein